MSLEVDFTKPKCYRSKPPTRQVKNLFTPFLEAAGLTGKFMVRGESMSQGSGNKVNSIRFKWKPVATGAALSAVHINFQLKDNRNCMDGLLIASESEIDGKELFERLKLAHQAQCFVLSEYKRHKGRKVSAVEDPMVVWSNDELLRKALGMVCDEAEEAENCLIPNAYVERVAADVYPDTVKWPDGGLTEMFQQAGYLDLYDDPKQLANGTCRVLIEPAAFAFAGRVHPDSQEESPSQPEPEEPEESDHPEPEPAPEHHPAIPGNDILTQLKRAKDVIANAQGAEKEKVRLEQDIKVARAEVSALQSQVDDAQKRIDQQREQIRLGAARLDQLEAITDSQELREARELEATIKSMVG